MKIKLQFAVLAVLAFLGSCLRPFRTRAQFANIGEGTHGTGNKSYYPDAALTARYLLVKRGSDGDHCAICGLNDDPLGPSTDSAETASLEERVNVALLGVAQGTLRVVTDGTINDGDYCKAGATGFATKATSTDLSFGRAIVGTDTTKASGDVIEIVHYVPVKAVF